MKILSPYEFWAFLIGSIGFHMLLIMTVLFGFDIVAFMEGGAGYSINFLSILASLGISLLWNGVLIFIIRLSNRPEEKKEI